MYPVVLLSCARTFVDLLVLHQCLKKLCTMYQREVDVDMLNAAKSMLADVSSVNPSSEQSLSTSVFALTKD